MGRHHSFSPCFFDDGFHGRAHELAELVALCAGPGPLLLTLLGPPGAGKTPLARELAARLEARGEAVRLVDLTRATRAEDVRAELEAAAGAERSSALDELEAALGALDLLVLDNAEHVAGPLRALLDELGSVRALVTSRVRLGLPREQLVELAYLPVDGEGDAPAPALALFLERARRRSRAFGGDPRELRAADAIVRALDGCPLALELAAARAGRASAEVVLAELRRSGHGILRARGAGDARFDSLREALEGSWALLDAPDREALAALAVLRGAWGLDTAAALLAVAPAEALDRVEALRDRSLVQMDPFDPGRYRVYEVVREHALARSDRAARARAVARLGAHLLAERWGPLAFARAEPSAADPASLRVVLDAQLGPAGDASMALQALLRLRLSVLWRGPHDGYAAQLEEVAARVAPSSAPTGDDVLVALARAELACWQGRFADAAEHAEGALEAVRARGGDAGAETFLLAQLGNLQGALYRPTRALALLEEAQARLPADAPPELEAHVLQQLATFLVLHDADEAERRLERALQVLRPLGPSRHRVQVLAVLAICRIARGAREAARAAVDEAQAVGGAEDAERWQAVLTLIEGALRHEDGAPEAARAAYGASREVFARNGNGWLVGLSSLLLGELELEAGRAEASERAYAEALRWLRPLGERLTTTWALAGLGALRARQGRRAEAERLLDAAREQAEAVPLEALRRAVALRRLELTLLEGEERVREVRAALEEARAEGAHMAIRLPLRLLEARLAELGEGAREPLVVQRDGRWFRRGEGARVDLARRRRLAKVLACLAGATDWVPLDAVFEAGWPGERCVPGSDVNRVHVTLSRLRSAGLGELIETEDGCFRITPKVQLELRD